LHKSGGVDGVLLRVVLVDIHRSHVDRRFKSFQIAECARHDSVALWHVQNIANPGGGQTNQNTAHHAHFFLIVKNTAVRDDAAYVLA